MYDITLHIYTVFLATGEFFTVRVSRIPERKNKGNVTIRDYGFGVAYLVDRASLAMQFRQWRQDGSYIVRGK